MSPEKENPLIDESLAAESKQGADDAAGLPSRLARYSRAHHRAVEMSNYLKETGEVKLARNLGSCGHYLLFRDYFTVGKVRLHAAKFCNKHLLCPLCAIRRGAKMVKSYLDRLTVIRQAKPHLKAYLVTFTVKDGPDLAERFQHLHKSITKYHKARHQHDIRREVQKASGAVWSYEFKRGKNSGQWHPHLHAVWLCEDAPDMHRIRDEWKAITGDSFMVDVRPFHDQEDVVSGFLEVFKYAVKFADLPLEDTWHGFQTLAGRRLIASFGDFFGVDVPEDLTDEKLDDLPYVEMLYKFVYKVGYTYCEGGAGAERAERVDGPTVRRKQVARKVGAPEREKPSWKPLADPERYRRARDGDDGEKEKRRKGEKDKSTA